jgi:histidinol dehydrogenase
MLSRVDLRREPPGAPVETAALLPAVADEAGVAATREAVREVIDAVRERGDAALRELTERFDGCVVDELRVPAGAIAAALDALDPELRGSLEYAADRIRAYHEAQRAAEGDVVLDADGVRVEETTRPVARAGLYVPGGRAAYPSTVLMTAIPARVAGVARIVLCVPPDRNGDVPAVTLAAAAVAGVDEVYRVGGAQAVAAMALGTESVPAVDVIVGPGNRFVSAAKTEVAGAGLVGIESPAGPSELVVVADGTAPAAWVAADLAAQAEHGPDGLAVLVTWDEAVADAVDAQLDELLDSEAGSRPELLGALASGGRAVLVRDADQAVAVANAVAPEHLELAVKDPDALLPSIVNAGAVFCGAFAATAMGDYVAGANHVLPTGRAARFASALRVDDFLRHLHVVRADADGARDAGRHGARIARAEGLLAHAWSLDVRARS